MRRTFRFLSYVLVLLFVLVGFFPDWINYKYWMISIKIHRNCFIYYYTTAPIIRTGWKNSLHLQIYVLVDLKDMDRNIYMTSTYNMNLRVRNSWIALFKLHALLSEELLLNHFKTINTKIATGLQEVRISASRHPHRFDFQFSSENNS